MNAPIDSYLWYFFLYSMIGYLCEICYCSISEKRFVNRGFLHGPYIPVYGFGGVAVAVLVTDLKNWPILVFLGGMGITSIIEYGAGVLLERVFHIRLWDYRARKFHIRGRVCLGNSVLFGLLSLAVVYFIHPVMQQSLANLPERLRSAGASVMLLSLAVDTTTSAMGMAAFTERLQRVKRLKAMLEPRLELLSQGRQRLVEALEAEIVRVSEQLRKSGNRILDAFPSIGSDELDMPSSLIRELIDKRRGRKKRKEESGTLHDDD